MTSKVVLCVTVDVESNDIRQLVNIKEICRKYNAPVTWFVDTINCYQPEALNLLKTYVDGGDEVGLHIHWEGSYDSGLKNIPIDRVKQEFKKALDSLSLHFQLKSFRGGGLCQTTPVLRILEQSGFVYDSSVAYKLNEWCAWYQGHENIPPIPAFYPSQDDYDIIAHTDDKRSTILEIPVTRGIPSPRFWCNMLEPGVTPVSVMKYIYQEHLIIGRSSPLIIMVMILHSSSWMNSSSHTIDDLDSFMNYVSSRNTEFETIEKAGHEWRNIWDKYPEVRSTLIRDKFKSSIKERILINLIRLGLSLYNLKKYPTYYIKSILPGISASTRLLTRK